MGLDVTLTKVMPTEVFSANITHNLNDMAEAAGIYKHLWRPEEIGVKLAGQLVTPLMEGLHKIKSDPAKYREFDSPNGWGTYDHFVRWLEEYLDACARFPDAEVRADR